MLWHWSDSWLSVTHPQRAMPTISSELPDPALLSNSPNGDSKRNYAAYPPRLNYAFGTINQCQEPLRQIHRELHSDCTGGGTLSHFMQGMILGSENSIPTPRHFLENQEIHLSSKCLRLGERQVPACRYVAICTLRFRVMRDMVVGIAVYRWADARPLADQWAN